jgi:hypothetical protein|tara:strand:+ start:1093 stop:1290 length:198 start_codon:yes stop_codon:yes gene_type:complete
MTEDRLKDFIIKENIKKAKEALDKSLLKSRKEVDINGNGTTGYVIKQGSQKGRVLKHIQIKGKNL